MFPTLQEAQVVSVDANKRRMVVQLPSAQSAEVRMGYHGPADAVRVSHKAMPSRGSWGLVAFPYGDNRAGIWVCSTYPALVDAITTQTDQFAEYDSHWSGAYEFMDQNGQWLKSFPDGTFLLVSGSATKPTMYRHTVDQNQVQQFTAFPDSERIPSPPSPRYFHINHGSGTVAEIDPSGNTTVTGASNAACTFKFNGATVVIDNSGNITATAASGKQFQAKANGGTITIDDNGGIEANAATGQNLKFSSAGAATSYTLVRTDLLVTWLANHTHTDPQGGDTGPPVQALSASTIQSTIANVSE